MNGGGYRGVTTGGYLLNYLSHRRSLFILGKGVPKEEMLTKKDREEAEFTYNFRKTHDLPNMKVEELVPLLSYWASGIRARVASELARRNPDEVIPHVRKLLQGENIWGA